jgi:hypothetical protein
MFPSSPETTSNLKGVLFPNPYRGCDERAPWRQRFALVDADHLGRRVCRCHARVHLENEEIN